MEKPDLTRIVQAGVRVTGSNLQSYLDQIRRDVTPHIRKLETDGSIRWFCFLFHNCSTVGLAHGPCIHLRMEPRLGTTIDEFKKLLPSHFENPQLKPELAISDIDVSQIVAQDWASAWKIVGEGSDWLLRMLDGHQTGPTDGQIIQFIHFLTNALSLGNRSYYSPNGRSF